MMLKLKSWKAILIASITIVTVNSETNYKKLYARQLNLNYRLDQKIESQRIEIIEAKSKIERLEERSKDKYLIRIPFTKIGIKDDHVTGAFWGIIGYVIIS